MKQTKTPKIISEQLRLAIAESGVSRYAISKETGIAQSTLCKFMQGKGGLSIEGIDAIGQLLGLAVVTTKGKGK